jgi:hypothetical protein
MMFPRAYLTAEQRADLDDASAPTMPQPLTMAPLAGGDVPGWWPSKRVVKQFLWVGMVVLVFALGFSVIATLSRMGKI